MSYLDHPVAEHLEDVVKHDLLKSAESRYLQATDQIVSKLNVRLNHFFEEEESAARLCSTQVINQLVEVFDLDKVARIRIVLRPTIDELIDYVIVYRVHLPRCNHPRECINDDRDD